MSLIPSMKFSSVTSHDVLSLIQVTGLSVAPVTANTEIKARKTRILAASPKNNNQLLFKKCNLIFVKSYFPNVIVTLIRNRKVKFDLIMIVMYSRFIF